MHVQKSNAVVVAKALLWKLHALPTLKHPGPGVYSTCTYEDSRSVKEFPHIKNNKYSLAEIERKVDL